MNKQSLGMLIVILAGLIVLGGVAYYVFFMGPSQENDFDSSPASNESVETDASSVEDLAPEEIQQLANEADQATTELDEKSNSIEDESSLENNEGTPSEETEEVTATTIEEADEDAHLDELEQDISEMEELYKDTETLIEETTELVNDLNELMEYYEDTPEELDEEITEALRLAEEALILLEDALLKAENLYNQYQDQIESAKNLVNERRDLYEAKASGDKTQFVKEAADYFVASRDELNKLKSLDQIDRSEFLIEYYSQVPTYLAAEQGFANLTVDLEGLGLPEGFLASLRDLTPGQELPTPDFDFSIPIPNIPEFNF